jgi:uracil-DNA glycosylase family 4
MINYMFFRYIWVTKSDILYHTHASMSKDNFVDQSSRTLSGLNKIIVNCRLCPRLVVWREQISRERVARFRGCEYWGKPVPGFGDPDAQMLIVGLAPAAHGANRTGRMFTGDRSGDWLFRALYKSGFATQPQSVSREDELQLNNCYITASIRCAPPANKPRPEELRACRPYFLKELFLLSNVRVVIGLGKIACDTIIDAYKDSGLSTLTKRPKFGHGVEVKLNKIQTLIASFHPSQQNTFTGKLTEPMFDAIFRRAQKLLVSCVRNNSNNHRQLASALDHPPAEKLCGTGSAPSFPEGIPLGENGEGSAQLDHDSSCSTNQLTYF